LGESATPAPSPAVTPNDFATFGELLRFLRHRAGLTQLELSTAVGYSESQISRLEKNGRAPDQAVLAARFVPALELHNEREWTARLLELAAASHNRGTGQSLESLPKPTLHKLPLQLTSFIGRERELAEVNRLLSESRLVTLTGAGGGGKTRLAIHVASEITDSFDDGVWWVELAGLADETLVPQTIAQTLGVREVPQEPLHETLANFLRTKQLLLALDNCEHVVTACARLIEPLLRACPHLKILATSREPLAIGGETIYQVPPLSLPEPNESVPNQLLQSEAARLFVERARTVKTDWTLNAQNGRAVAQLCQRLDGIPLAIELAAARVKVLTVNHITARLDDRFNLLTTGNRTVLPRHQTLRATIDWSFDLLPEDTRILFRRLAVFAGGFTLNAAESICSDELLPAPTVLDVLTRLVDRSLVIVEHQHEEERYRMLETIREYAREKLVESKQDRAIRDRHLEFFAKLAEEAEVRVWSAEHLAWTRRIKSDRDNLRAAMAWALESDVARGLRIAGAMGYFWLWPGDFTEGREWLNRLMAQNIQVPPEIKSKGLFLAGFLAMWQNDLTTAQPLLEQSATLSEAISDERGLANALGALAYESLWRGDLDRASNLAERGAVLYRKIGDKPDLAGMLDGQSAIARRRGDYEAARALSEESLNLITEGGDRWDRASPLFSLGEVSYLQEDYAAARTFYEESLALWREVGDTNGCALATNALGEIARATGDYVQAAGYYNESITLTPVGVFFGHSSKPVGIAAKYANLGFTVLHQADDAQALALFRESLLAAQKSKDKYSIVFCLIGFAGVALAWKQAQRAARLLGASSSLLNASSIQLEPADRIEFESILAVARTQMDKQSFRKALAAGRALDLYQAIEYGLQSSESNKNAAYPHIRGSAKQAFGGLTAREREVVALIEKRMSNREIAEELVVSERTVETHVTNILNKLGFTSRAQIRKWAVEKGLGKRE
jgi:non-specific serine/threonine protein kinase